MTFEATHCHYKGNLYQVICYGREEATMGNIVIYHSQEGDVVSRSKKDFEAINGKFFRQKAHFEPIT